MISSRALLIITSLVLFIARPTLCAGSDADYARTLGRISNELSAIRKMEAAHPGSGKAALDSLNQSLPDSVPVTSQGKTFEADLQWIKLRIDEIGQAKGKERLANIDTLINRIGAASSADEGTPTNSATSLSAAHAALTDALKIDNPKPSFWDRLVGRVLLYLQVHVFQPLFDKIGDAFGKVPSRTWAIIGWIVKILAIVVLVAGLAYVIRLLRTYYSGSGPEEEGSTKAHASKVRRPSVELLLKAAEEEASEGRYKEALRHIYLATILLLDHAQLVSFADGRTNWEYVRILKRQSKPDQAKVFGDMTLCFDRLIYGGQEVGGSDYLAGKDSFHQLESMI